MSNQTTQTTVNQDVNQVTQEAAAAPKIKPFKLFTAGYEVTEQNFKEVAEKIKKEFGICPALGDIVFSVASASLNTTGTVSRKEMYAAMDAATKMIGYKPSYFNTKMRQFNGGGSDY